MAAERTAVTSTAGQVVDVALRLGTFGRQSLTLAEKSCRTNEQTHPPIAR